MISEFGYKLKAMASPKASPNDVALKAAFLDAYARSGDGKLIDPSAYADTAKNTPPIFAPSITLIGESTPEALFEGIDERVISDGLLPRFLTFQTDAPRPYLNPYVNCAPDPALVERLADLTAICLSYSLRGRVAQRVPLDPEAAGRFAAFERQATDEVNAAKSGAHGELWNRAYAKALKVASLVAVGVNPVAPVVTEAEAAGAISMVTGQTRAMISKFESGEVGEIAGNEMKQVAHVSRVIGDYLLNPFDYGKYDGDFEMHCRGIITEAHISRRVWPLPAFKNDRLGSTAALKRVLKHLIDSAYLEEIPRAQMIA